MVSVYRAALLLRVMSSTNAQSALKKEKEVCAPRRVGRAWLFLTHHDLLSLFEVSSQVSLKPLARQMLERSRFPKRGHCQQKKEKRPRGLGNPRGSFACLKRKQGHVKVETHVESKVSLATHSWQASIIFHQYIASMKRGGA